MYLHLSCPGSPLHPLPPATAPDPDPVLAERQGALSLSWPVIFTPFKPLLPGVVPAPGTSSLFTSSLQTPPIFLSILPPQSLPSTSHLPAWTQGRPWSSPACPFAKISLPLSSRTLKMTTWPRHPCPTSLQTYNGGLCPAGFSPHCLSSILGLPPCPGQSLIRKSAPSAPSARRHWLSKLGKSSLLLIPLCPYFSSPPGSAPTPSFLRLSSAKILPFSPLQGGQLSGSSAPSGGRMGGPEMQFSAPGYPDLSNSALSAASRGHGAEGPDSCARQYWVRLQPPAHSSAEGK